MSQMDEFGRHEVLHMSMFLQRAVAEELIDHEQVQANPEWKALAETAFDALYRLYQSVGGTHLGGGA